MLICIADLLTELGELYTEVLRHIPQILFEGYQPAAFDPEVQKKFGIWVLTECLLAVFLLPNGRKRRKWEKDDDEDED